MVYEVELVNPLLKKLREQGLLIEAFAMFHKYQSFLRFSVASFFQIAFIASGIFAGEISVDGKALASFGTKKYQMTRIDRSSGKAEEQKVGLMEFSAVVEKDSVSLTNLTRMYLPDGKRFIQYRTRCFCTLDDNKLMLQRIDSNVTRSDKMIMHESKTVITPGKITHNTRTKGKGKTLEEKWRDATIVDVAVFFLVPQLTRTKGESVSLPSVIPTPTDVIPLASARTITCYGVDPDFSESGQQYIKYVNREKGELSGISYWVDEKGLLQRVMLSKENRLDLIQE